MNKTWTSHKHVMNNMWTTGHELVRQWTNCELMMNNCEQVLNKSWKKVKKSNFGKNHEEAVNKSCNKSWTILEQVANKLRTSFDQGVNMSGTRSAQVVNKSWTNFWTCCLKVLNKLWKHCEKVVNGSLTTQTRHE